MKKVININFQGRVIPIEETAYDLLQQYIDSLRNYFANEEGRDEIINDIEGRIAELFSERLKKGATCITDEDVNAVAASMGRPSDFEQAAADGGTTAASAGTYSQQQQQQSSDYTYTNAARGRGRLYRNADDKILGGVCSGLANYLGIDPVVMRILFVVFIGALFWVYIVLWIIVPSQSAQSNITKRLYRSADDKVIGGVCGGMAAYFNISTWIPRLIFALPLIIGIISSPFNMWWGDMDFWWGPKVVTGSLGFTLFVTYLILWISVPVAVTSAEKLEMRGERVDLNSIRNTVKEDMENFKTRAQSWGSEVKESAQRLGEKAKAMGQTAGAQAKTYADQAIPAARSTRSGIGHVIGILFKAFFLFIAGIVAISLFGVLMGLLFGGFVVFPFKDFFLEGFWQNTLGWLSLLLFLGIPIIALITWLIRRIAGVRSRNHYLGYVFGSLWTIGLISFILLIGMYTRNFRMPGEREEEIAIAQPATGKMMVDVAPGKMHYYSGAEWFGVHWDEDWPIYGSNEDTLMLNNVRIHVAKSKDSLYHVHRYRISQGRNAASATALAGKIQFDVTQQDSTLMLPKGFGISRQEKFRNQRVLLVIEVPVGKRIQFDHNVNDYSWYTINFNRRRGWNIEYDDNWDYAYGWRSGVEYVMTAEGRLESTSKAKDNAADDLSRNEEGVDVRNDNRTRKEQNRRVIRDSSGDYRYKAPDNSRPAEQKDSAKTQEEISKANKAEETNDGESPESLSTIYRLSRFSR